MARAVVLGAGVVGRATGAGMAELEHDVEYCDVDEAVVSALHQRGAKASFELDLRGPAAFVFLTLPTPARPEGHYDLTALRAGTVAVGEALRDATERHTIVVRSTVPPGTCEGVVLPLLEEVSGRTVGSDFALASNPEFLRARTALQDFLHPWITVVGARSPGTVDALRNLYRPLGGEFQGFFDPAEAELAKCAHNLFNAAKISFWNEMWRVATALGIECDGVAETVARSAEGSFNPLYGIRGGAPFSGSCLPKDVRGFLGFARDLGIDMPVLSGVQEINQEMLDRSQPESAAAGTGRPPAATADLV